MSGSADDRILILHERRCLTVEGLMAKLSRSRSEITNLRNEKGFPAGFTLRKGGALVWDEQDVDLWIDARKAASAAERGETPGMVESVRRMLREGA